MSFKKMVLYFYYIYTVHHIFLQKKTILLQKTTSFPKKKRFWSIGLTSANATCFMHVFHELWCINCTNMCIYYTRICAYTYIWIPAYEYIYMNNTYIYMNAYTYIHICTYLECERMEFFTSITFIKSIIYLSAKNCIPCKQKKNSTLQNDFKFLYKPWYRNLNSYLLPMWWQKKKCLAWLLSRKRHD